MKVAGPTLAKFIMRALINKPEGLQQVFFNSGV